MAQQQLPNVGQDPISKALQWIKDHTGGYLQNLNTQYIPQRFSQGVENDLSGINPQPNTGNALMDTAINTTRNVNPMFDAAYKFAKLPDKNPVNLVKGALKGTENMLGMDVEHGQFLPDPGKAVNNAIEHPVNTAIAVASLKSGGSKSEEPSPVSTEPNATTTMGNRMLRGQYNLSPKGSQMFSQNDINALADYGITSPKSVAKAAQIFTGEGGIGSKMVRNAIAESNPVPFGQLTDASGKVIAPGLIDMAKNIEENMDLASTTARKSFMNSALKITNKGGENIANGDPLEVYDFMKKFEAKAANYRKMSTPEALEQANAYQTFANELEDRIFNSAGANQSLSKIPFSMDDFNKLNDISPKLAQNVIDTLKNGTVDQLRSLQAPFVRGAKAVEESVARTGNTPLSLKQVLELYIGTQGNPLAAGLFLADTNAGKNIIGNTLRKIGQVKENLPNPTANGLAPIATNAALSSVNPSLQNESNEQNAENSSNNIHGGTIPQSASNVNSAGSNGTWSISNTPSTPTDLNGNDFSVPSPSQITDASGKVIGTNQNDYNQRVTEINNQIAGWQKQEADNPYDNTIKQTNDALIKAAQTQLSSMSQINESSKPLNTAYTFTKQLVGNVEAAINSLNTTSPDITNLNGTIDKLKKSLDPNYAALSERLSSIQKSIGTQLNGSTRQALQAELAAINQQVRFDYLTAISTFVGGNTTSGNVAIQQNPAFSPTTQLPPIGQDEVGKSNFGTGTPHPFVY